MNGTINKHAKLILVLFFVSILFSTSVFASQISVKKRVDDTRPLSVDEPLTIFLEFDNPFGKDIPIKIVDKNIVGQNGVDITCLEYNLPNGHNIIGYDPIQPFAAGDFTLEPVSVTYTNPETNKEETVRSEPLVLNISKSSQGNNVVTTGITQIYQCNGQTIRSTSIQSGSSSTSIQISSGGTQISAGGNQNQQSLNQQIQDMQNQASQGNNDLQNRMQNNQQAQDMNAIKQQMAQQQAQQEKNNQDLKNGVEQDKQFQQLENELTQQGYKPKSENYQGEGNQTGKFAKQYQNDKGENAQISGEMNKGNMNQLNRESKEDRERIQKALENSKDFQNMKQSLEQQNYQMQSLSYSNMLNNQTTFQAQFNNNNQSKANITGNVQQNNNVTDLKIEKQEPKKQNYLWIWWSLLALVLMYVLGYYLYKKYFKKKVQIPQKAAIKEIKKPINYKKEALEMILEAISLFEKDKFKQAYTKVSEALRFFYKYKFNTEKELTRDECIKLLKKEKVSKQSINDANECLDLCDLVKFAKYEPNKLDFNKIVKLAKEQIE